MADTPGTSTPTDPLAFMNRLSDHVYLYRPTESTAAAAQSFRSSSPKLVIVATWMDAKPVHIAKYLAPYRDGEVFPGSPPPVILLIRSSRRQVFTLAEGRAAVKPAVAILQAFLEEQEQEQEHPDVYEATTPPRVLVHTFSNGGCILLSHLHDELAQTQTQARIQALPPHVTIYDSSPGRFHYAGAIGVLAVGLAGRPWLVRLAALPVLHAMVVLYVLRTWLARHLLGRTPALSRAWDPLLDRAGTLQHERRRAYLYSSGDRLVWYRDVEIHAALARQRGFAVDRLEHFAGSDHVTHARTDGPRYWRTVRAVWEAGPAWMVEDGATV